jgi:hypothetical protein
VDFWVNGGWDQPNCGITVNPLSLPKLIQSTSIAGKNCKEQCDSDYINLSKYSENSFKQRVIRINISCEEVFLPQYFLNPNSQISLLNALNFMFL